MCLLVSSFKLGSRPTSCICKLLKGIWPRRIIWWSIRESLGVCEEEQVRDFLQAPETAYLVGSFLGVLGWGLSPGMLSGMCVGGGLGPCAPL